MKIFFTASIVGKQRFLEQYSQIVKLLNKAGHEVEADHILQTTSEEIRYETQPERTAFHQFVNESIHACDVLIAETSYPSISVGYQMSLAMQLGKPILILYSEGDPPSLLAGETNENVFCQQYTYDSLEPILQDFLQFAQSNSDTRFTFSLPRDLSLYLDQQSQRTGVSKAQYLRSLITRDRSNE